MAEGGCSVNTDSLILQAHGPRGNSLEHCRRTDHMIGALRSEAKRLRDDLLDRFCHRTGKRSRETPAPLYRIRAALAYLWNRFFTPVLPLLQNSGCLMSCVRGVAPGVR